MKKLLTNGLALAVIGIGMMAGNALALPILTISDGTNTVTVNDATDPMVIGDGVVLYAGFLGNSSIVLGGGSGFPALGTVGSPVMHLTAAVLSAPAATTFTFALTDTFTALDPMVKSWFTEFGGAPSNGNATLDVLLDGVSIANFASFGSGQTSVVLPSDVTNFTITMQGTIKGAGTSFDANVSAPVPEPATMFLFGTGLVSFAGLTLNRKKK